MLSRRFVCPALLALLASAVFAPVAHADDDDEPMDEGPEMTAAAAFSLDDLIGIAVQKAPDLSRAKIDHEAAKGVRGAAAAEQQWQLQIAAQYKRDAIGQNVAVPAFTPVDTEILEATLGLGRNLPTGGRVDVELGLNHSDVEQNIPEVITAATQAAANGANLDEFYTTVQSTARVTLKQPLVKGFGPEVALATQHKADFQFSLATLQAQLQAEESIRDIINDYWELAYSNYEIQTRLEAIHLAEEQEKVTRAEMRAGKSSDNAVNAVIFELNTRKEALLKSELDLEKRSMDLRRKVGLGLDKRQIVMRPTEKLEVGKEEWDIDETLTRSHQANRRLATVALQQRLADVDVAVAKDGQGPQVDVTLSGALKGTAGDTGAAFSSAGSGDGYEVMAGLQVTFDLSGAAKSNYQASLAKRRRLDVDREDTERQLDAEIVSAVKAVTFSRTRVMLADKSIEAADDNAKTEKFAFQAGRTTNYSVMQRQSELIDARLRRGRAVADYHIAVAQLQFLSGTILEQYNVNVRPKSARDEQRVEQVEHADRAEREAAVERGQEKKARRRGARR
jgi:outer membrane protein TolC